MQDPLGATAALDIADTATATAATTASIPAAPATDARSDLPATCAGEALVLDDAVLRSWSFDGHDATLALLVSSDSRGFRTVRLRYSGARIVGRDGVTLPDVPLEAGRSYVLRGEERIHGPEGREHRLRFFPAPEFGIAFDDLVVES